MITQRQVTFSAKPAAMIGPNVNPIAQQEAHAAVTLEYSAGVPHNSKYANTS